MPLCGGETVPALSPHRLASLPPLVSAGDHLHRPRSTLGFPTPCSLSETGRATVGAQIITRTHRESTMQVSICDIDSSRLSALEELDALLPAAG